MRIGEAMAQAMLAARRLADMSVLESRVTARRYAALAEISAYWAAKCWVYYDVVAIDAYDMDGDDADALKGVMSKAIEAVDVAAEEILEGRHGVPRTEVSRNLRGLRNALANAKTLADLVAKGGDWPSVGVCMTCGATAEMGEACPVCGGGGNQVAYMWAL